MEDLMAIDAITCGLLETVRNCQEFGICDEESFAAKYGEFSPTGFKLRWVYNGSDGIERELRKGSSSRIVTFSTRCEFCDAVLAARLGEFDKQVAAIARGMGEVVPMRVLQLFSWQQLELLVAGDPKIDIEVWKSHTETSGVSPKTLALFWKVMSSLSEKDQSGFVRFAWGRSRLPAAKDFTTKMRLTAAGSSTLPVAHTCFFSVEMPSYKTEEEMRHGLLTAIHFSGGILNG